MVNQPQNSGFGIISLDPTSPEFHKAYALKLASEIVSKLPEWALQLGAGGGYALYVAVLGLGMWIYPSADEQFRSEYDKITKKADEVVKDYATKQGFNLVISRIGISLYFSIMNYFYRERWIRHIKYVSIKIPSRFKDKELEEKLKEAINVLEKTEIEEEKEEEKLSD